MEPEHPMLPDEDELPLRLREPYHRPGMWLAVTALALLTVLSLLALVRSRNRLRELDASRAQTAAALSQAQSQIQALTSRLDALNAAAQVREVAAAPAPASRVRPVQRPPDADEREDQDDTPEVRRPAPARVLQDRAPAEPQPRDDLRLASMESQIAAQKQELAKTRDELTKAQTDLQGHLHAARQELQISVARNHEQLEALQKRGERNFYEFQLDKSKDFRRVGPISVSLRKVNTKHDFYDMTLQVQDITLEKKHVNLYEPVWVNVNGHAVELVVNRLGKDHIEGYIAEPKYRKSELAVADSAQRELQKR